MREHAGTLKKSRERDVNAGTLTWTFEIAREHGVNKRTFATFAFCICICNICHVHGQLQMFPACSRQFSRVHAYVPAFTSRSRLFLVFPHVPACLRAWIGNVNVAGIVHSHKRVHLEQHVWSCPECNAVYLLKNLEKGKKNNMTIN